MNILGTLLENPAVLGQLAQQFSLTKGDTSSVLAQLVPVLAKGMKFNTQQPSGLESLASALSKGQHSQYFDNPSQATNQEAVSDGNSILGHLLGSKDVSRGLASRAEQNTGVSSDLIKKMLPVVAAMAMGALSKKNSGAAASNMAPQAQAQGQAGALGGLLESFLDVDGDGSMADDLLGMAGKFFAK
ncbi:MAG: DUF937 domain-containing protein [Pseudomonadales bacterium]